MASLWPELPGVRQCAGSAGRSWLLLLAPAGSGLPLGVQLEAWACPTGAGSCCRVAGTSAGWELRWRFAESQPVSAARKDVAVGLARIARRNTRVWLWTCRGGMHPCWKGYVWEQTSYNSPFLSVCRQVFPEVSLGGGEQCVHYSKCWSCNRWQARQGPGEEQEKPHSFLQPVCGHGEEALKPQLNKDMPARHGERAIGSRLAWRAAEHLCWQRHRTRCRLQFRAQPGRCLTSPPSAGQPWLLIRVPSSSQREEDVARAFGAGVSYGGLCRAWGLLLKMSLLSLEIKPSLLIEAFISSLMRMQQPQAELKSCARVLLPNGRT